MLIHNLCYIEIKLKFILYATILKLLYMYAFFKIICINVRVSAYATEPPFVVRFAAHVARTRYCVISASHPHLVLPDYTRTDNRFLSFSSSFSLVRSCHARSLRLPSFARARGEQVTDFKLQFSNIIILRMSFINISSNY